MKRIIVLLCLVLALFSKVSIAQSVDGEVYYVMKFLDVMLTNADNEEEDYKPYVSPKYLKKNKLNIDYYKVNRYSPVDYCVKSFDKSTGTVVADIWGSDKSWIHELSFQVVNEKGDYYLWPMEHSESWIEPWSNVTTNVSSATCRVSNYVTGSGNLEKDFVTKFLDYMISDENEDKYKRDLISKGYIDAYDLNIKDFKINTYFPVGYEIESYDPSTGIVSTQVWGEDKGWVHRLTFKIVKENGKMYFYPSRHSDEYIDPWHKAETYINEETVTESTYDFDPVYASSKNDYVTKFIQAWIDDEDDDYLRRFISPDYCDDEVVDLNDYYINNYSPVDFCVVGQEGSYTIAYVWGSDKGWIHKVYFEVTSEDGDYYLYPSEISENDYVYPWYKVETYVDEALCSATTSTGTNNYTDPSEMLDDFLQLMVDDADYDDFKPFIAPSYAKSNNININDYKINKYFPEGYCVGKYDLVTGKINSKIWGSDKGWIHELIFKVVSENGKIYFYPSSHSDSYIDPWFEANTYVDDANCNGSSTGNTVVNGEGAKELARKFLEYMVSDDNEESDKRAFISPKFCSDKSISANDYKINTYYPVDYCVGDYDASSGIVTTYIWGSDKGWVHKLTFKVTSEGGKDYFYASEASGDYIYPWDQAETYVSTPVCNNGLSTDGEKEKALVHKFLSFMVSDANDEDYKRDFIAPSYMRLNNININDYKVNTYYPVGYSVDGYDPASGMVESTIWGEDKGWIKKLYFKVVKEDSQLYFFPMKHSTYMYIHPWYRLETDLQDK